MENNQEKQDAVSLESDQVQGKQDNISLVERDLGGELVHFNSLPNQISELFSYYFTEDFLLNFIQCIKHNDNIYRIVLFDNDREYIIHINVETGYIGCVMKNRKTYPGETWVRGNDYPDGKLENGHEVLKDILNRIFKNVFWPISKSVRKEIQ